MKLLNFFEWLFQASLDLLRQLKKLQLVKTKN